MPSGSVTPAAAGSQLTAEVALTNAQIKALAHPTPVTVVAAPGAGKYLAFHGGLVVVDATATAYGHIEATAYMAFCYGAAASDCSVGLTSAGGLGALLGGDAEVACTTLPPVVLGASGAVVAAYFDASQVENLALGIYIFNAALSDLTGGNAANSGRAKVWYSLEDI